MKLVQRESHRPPLWSYQGRVPFPLLEEDPPSCLSLSSRTGVKTRRSWFSLVSKVSAGDTAFLSSLQRMGQGPQGFSCSEKLPLSSWGVSHTAPWRVQGTVPASLLWLLLTPHLLPTMFPAPQTVLGPLYRLGHFFPLVFLVSVLGSPASLPLSPGKTAWIPHWVFIHTLFVPF